MSEHRHELKVGVFVFVGLALIAGLILYFSKGLSLFKPSYTVFLKTSDVGGLKTKAKVMLSGVEVGTVEDILLTPDGKTARVQLDLLSKYVIYQDARFSIDSLGFLGDQYVAVQPGANEGQPLTEGSEVFADPPFDFLNLARSAMFAMTNVNRTVEQLLTTIQRVDRMVLNEVTLTNLALAVSNFVVVSERAVGTVDELKLLVTTNAPALNATMTNLQTFSDRLNGLALELNDTVVTNRQALTRSMNNLEQASLTARQIMTDVQNGRGVAGSLVGDEQLKLELSLVMTNLSAVSGNLNVLTSNINNRGLWSVLWKPKDKAKK